MKILSLFARYKAWRKQSALEREEAERMQRLKRDEENKDFYAKRCNYYNQSAILEWRNGNHNCFNCGMRKIYL